MIKAAEKASKSVIRDFGEVEKLQVSKKGPYDFVTKTDKLVEKILIDELSKTIGIYVQKYFDTHGGKLPPTGVYHYFLRQFEGPLIETALLATAGNQLKCADLLGINRNTLRKKVSDLDILVSRGRKLM